MSYQKNVYLAVVLCLQPLFSFSVAAQHRDTHCNPLKWISGGVAILSGLFAAKICRDQRNHEKSITAKFENLNRLCNEFISHHGGDPSKKRHDVINSILAQNNALLNDPTFKSIQLMDKEAWQEFGDYADVQSIGLCFMEVVPSAV